MQKKHFTVVGELGWQLALDNVVLDNLLTGQASAESWQAGATGTAFEAGQILSQARQQVTAVGAVGADYYGQLVINQLDLAGIDSSAVLCDEQGSTTLKCLINQGKKDSLSINYRSLAPVIAGGSDIKIGDWLYLISSGNDLNQINDWLHQAVLQQAQTILQFTEVAERELKRANYLLEDIDTLIVSAELAKKITTKSSLDQATTMLLNDVKTVIIVAKTRLILASAGRLINLETTEINPSDITKIGAWVVAGLVRAKQPDLARVLATTWQAISDKKYNLRETSL